MKVSELKEGISFTGIYLLESVEKRKTNNGNDYLSIKISDNSGDIDAKLWSVSKEHIQQLKSGAFANVTGDIIKYRDTLQMKIDTIEIMDENKVNKDDFIKKAPFNSEDLRLELQNYLYQIDDRIINTIVSQLLKKYQEEIMTYPAAAKIHHAYQGGLLYHIVSMLKLAEAIIKLYPQLDKNYLYAGVILHDLGKVEELSGAFATEYTLKGKLVGHIPIIASQIEHVAQSIGEAESEQVILLIHIVLSHHGKLEYGSPVLPLTREAEVLTFIDNLDARMETLNRELSSVEEGEFTQRIFSLDNRAFYKPNQNK